MKSTLRTVILLLVRILGAPGAFIAARQAQRWDRSHRREIEGTMYTGAGDRHRKGADGTRPPSTQRHPDTKRTIPTHRSVDDELASSRPLRSPSSGDNALRILLVRPDHLGDMLLVTPILQAIKERVPNAHITMMVGQWSADIVERHPAIDNIITCPFPGFQRASQKPLAPYQLLLAMAKQLHRNKYDLAINLRPDFWWGGALLYLAGIPRRIGYAIAPGTPFLTQALTFPPAEHTTVSNLRLASTALQALGYDALAEPYTPANYPLYFKPTPGEQTAVNERLQREGITDETPLVVIHAGTGGAVKLWRTEGWAHIANRLASTQILPTPARIVLTGSPKEHPMLEEIAQASTTPPLLMTDLTVGELAALLARAQLVLGVDNGPLHMAVAQDTSSIRIYGPTDSRIFGPWGDATRHITLVSTQKCADCPLIPCSRLDFSPEELVAHPCVRVITEGEVEGAIRALVGLKCAKLSPSAKYP